MKTFFTYLFLVFGLPLFSQFTVDKTSYDFGEVYAEEETYVDFVFKNTSDKTHFLLTIDKPRDVYYIFSKKSIEPDSSVVIRLKINDARKGKFNYFIDVYFSSETKPITLNLYGNIKEVSGQNSMTACPDFNSTPPTSYSTEFPIIVKVIDSLTGEPIKNSRVYFVERGELVGDDKTNSKGVVEKRIPLGWYYITASHPSYIENYYDGYLNFKRNVVIIKLKQPEPQFEELAENPVPIIEEEEIELVIEEEPEEIVEVVSEPEIVEPEPEIIEEEAVEIVSVDPVIEEPIDHTPLSELPDTLFDEVHFKHSNITFILDVSTSMSGNGKLSLLRLSMIELTKILRPNDMVSILEYSSETRVILKNTSGSEKDIIIETVKNLKPSGMTAGGTAIKQGFKLNKKTHIENGNNIVIMITDGAFNKGDKDYLASIEDNFQKKGVRFSVVGIKMSEYLTGYMKDITVKGGGEFVQIRTIEEAQNKLIQEIRRTAFKSS